MTKDNIRKTTMEIVGWDLVRTCFSAVIELIGKKIPLSPIRHHTLKGKVPMKAICYFKRKGVGMVLAKDLFCESSYVAIESEFAIFLDLETLLKKGDQWIGSVLMVFLLKRQMEALQR